MAENPQITIINTRRRLARYGEQVLPRTAYHRLIEDGFLEKPLTSPSGKKFHTLGQISRCTRRIEEQALAALETLSRNDRGARTMQAKIAAKFNRKVNPKNEIARS
jgi:hypothetical protein